MKTVTKEFAVEQAKIEIQTTCDGCVFGSIQNNDDENPDNYCSVGRLKKFQDVGCEILNVDSEQKNRNYKIINGRICNMLRSSIWSQYQNHNGIEEKDFAEKARKEVNVRCSFIIYAGKDDFAPSHEDKKARRSYEKEKVKQVVSTMKSSESGIIKPEKIVLVNNAGIKPYDFLNYLRIQAEESGLTSEWSMEYISADETKKIECEKEVLWKCIDIAVKNISTQYYSIFKCGDEIQENYLSDIDKSINEDLNQFLILEPEEENELGYFVQRLAHQQFGGNKKRSLVAKLKEGCEEQECKTMIQPLSSIVKSQ